MRHYDAKRKLLNEKRKEEEMAKKRVPMPERNIAVPIRKGLVIWIDDPSKIEETKLRYANK